MTIPNQAPKPQDSDPFDEFREAFTRWLRSGGTASIVRVRVNDHVIRYSVDSLLRILSSSDELLRPEEWRLVQEWLVRHGAWEWTSAGNGRKTPPLTFRLAVSLIWESLP